MTSSFSSGVAHLEPTGKHFSSSPSGVSDLKISGKETSLASANTSRRSPSDSSARDVRNDATNAVGHINRSAVDEEWPPLPRIQPTANNVLTARSESVERSSECNQQRNGSAAVGFVVKSLPPSGRLPRSSSANVERVTETQHEQKNASMVSLPRLTSNFSSLTRTTVEIPAYLAFHSRQPTSTATFGCGDLGRNKQARPYELRVIFDFGSSPFVPRSIQIKLSIADNMQGLFLAKRGLPNGADLKVYVSTFPLLMWPQGDKEIISFQNFSYEPFQGVVPNIAKFDKNDIDRMDPVSLLSLTWKSDVAGGTPEIKGLPGLIREYERQRVFDSSRYDHIRLKSGIEALRAAVAGSGTVQLVVAKEDIQEEELRYLTYCSELVARASEFV